ncbi:MAG: hypothetical protein IJ604_02865 [Prevotella sp.]|nr:hypothetical protein [Prevotella sp.]MBR1462305.1 hypothetical protein [Prevotella sp.]
MKKILLSVVALAAMMFAPTSADAQSKQPLVYNFAGLVKRANIENAEGPTFFIYESSYKPDVERYGFVGYQNYEGEALGKECHVWRRYDRYNANLTANGLVCPTDREMAVDGLDAGSVVKVNYDATGVEGAGKELVYVTGATAGTVAEIGGAEAVAGKTTIASGAEILVKKGAYIVFQVKKGMVISSIEVSNVLLDYENGTTVKSDFAAEANTYKQPANLNGSTNNGQEFYVWASEGAPNRNRNQYKGYTWTEGLALPQVCNVWLTSDRINGNIVAGGLRCPNDREFIVSGLESGSEVTITFDATNASTKELLWVPGNEVVLEATVNGENAVIAETTIPSATPIKVVSTEKGYIAVKVFKGMIISKVVIKNAAETLTYDFAAPAMKSKLTGLNGSADNGQAFYVWERTDKADSYRQDFKGYQNYTGNNLPATCQVWRRSERFDQDATLANGGLNFTGDRETVINGLKAGDIVKITYDATNASTKELLWATGASAKVVATVNGAEPVSGVTTFPSGAEIKIVSTENGYFGFRAMKGMVITKVEVLSPVVESENINNDFAAAGVVIPVQPEKQNGSDANGQIFYIWEKSDKTNSKRTDYKGYKWTEGLALPEVCHVWRRTDNINNSIVVGGLNCPNDKEMVIDGLESFSTVTITYDATNASDKELLYVLSPESSTLAKVNGPLAVPGETTITSGTKIEIPYTVDGYIAVRVKKGMIISEIKIEYAPTATGIENVNAAAEADGEWYNMQGVRVAQPVKGVYIHNGKKVVVK